MGQGAQVVRRSGRNNRHDEVQRLLLAVEISQKFVLLSEIATGKYIPIPDPVLIKDIDEYYSAMDEIKKYLSDYAEKLRSRLSRD